MRKENKTLPIDKLELNTGQVEWLPKNPRQWTQTDIDNTAASIREDEDFLEDRPLLVVPDGKRYVVFAGNLRLSGAKQEKLAVLPCVVYYPETETDFETVKRRALKDNGSFGQWDFDELANSWDDFSLVDFGIPAWPQEGGGFSGDHGGGDGEGDGLGEDEDDSEEDMDKDSEYSLKLKFPSIEQRKEWEEEAELQGVKICRGLNWGRGEESEHRCDLLPREKRYKLKGFYYISCFHNTTTGERLSIIKQQQANIKKFADAAVEQIKKLNITGECTLVSAPARKHIENNFAENICEKIAQDLCLNYERGIISILSKDRFRPVFSLKHPVKTECVILYDDIITTGKTIAEMKRLFDNKEVFVIIGIKNDHPFKV